MVTDRLKELEVARTKLAELERSIASELNAELASLPAKYGFDSADAFIAAVDAAGGNAPKRRGRKPGSKVSASTPAKGQKRTRAKITDDTRAQVKKLVGEEKTGAEIAKALGISLPSVQNIKKALGLVKSGKNRK